jgi:hypothetical protein
LALTVIFSGPLPAADFYYTVPATHRIPRLSEQDFRPISFEWLAGGETIIANGRITPGSSERFKSFLAAQAVPRSARVWLNSPGGDLAEGLQMGKVIRAHQLDTLIARVGPAAGTALRPFDRIAPAECDSSCNFVFMGGIKRELAEHSNFGVHRFQAAGQSRPNTSTDPNNLPLIETAQIASAVLVEYLQEMGVDPNFLTYMAGTREITYLPQNILQELRIVRGYSTNWETNVRNGSYVLRGTGGYLPEFPKITLDLICMPLDGVKRSLLASVRGQLAEDTALVADANVKLSREPVYPDGIRLIEVVQKTDIINPIVASDPRHINVTFTMNDRIAALFTQTSDRTSNRVEISFWTNNPIWYYVAPVTVNNSVAEFIHACR